MKNYSQKSFVGFNGLSKNNPFLLKCLFFLFILFLVGQGSVFAQTTITITDPGTLANSGIAKVLGSILWFFGSIYMKAICVIALAGLVFGLLTSRGEPGMFKKFLPWIVGVCILLSLSAIVNIIWGDGGSLKVGGTFN